MTFEQFMYPVLAALQLSIIVTAFITPVWLAVLCLASLTTKVSRGRW